MINLGQMRELLVEREGGDPVSCLADSGVIVGSHRRNSR